MKLKEATTTKYEKMALNALEKYMNMDDSDFLNVHISISESNTKTGNTPSVSFLPVITCGNCTGCTAYCYAIRMALRFPAVMDSWARNTAIYKRDPFRFFDEVTAYIEKKNPPAFRYNVGGEVPDLTYIHFVNTIARKHNNTLFWTYTKRHDIVNDYIENVSRYGIAKNLTIMFSMGMDCFENNPHGFPEFRFIPSGASIPDGAHVCGGHCRACLESKTGCPYGRSSVVKEH